EQKNIQQDRTILVPGPPNEIKLVQQIYERFIDYKWSYRQIAGWINSRGTLTHLGTKWTDQRVRYVLTNEKYAGDLVYNRTSRKMGGKLVANPPDIWIKCENAFTPVVTREKFNAAQA